MGSRSGYDQVCAYLADVTDMQTRSVWRVRKPRTGVSLRTLASISRHSGGTALHDSSSAAAELHAIWQSLLSRPDLLHVLYVEENYGLLSTWRKLRRFPLIGTVHQPRRWWQETHAPVGILSDFEALIGMSRAQVAFLNQYVPGRVHFVPHGVDVQFFCPRTVPQNVNGPHRFVSCGVWMRDLETLEAIINRVSSTERNVVFDLVVPARARDLPVIKRLVTNDRVVWHHGVSDEQLREIYRNAVALVLPLLDCTANNALLEAMACGLPVLASNVGGIPDYTADTFAQLIPVSDSEAFVRCMLELLDDPAGRARKAAAARQYAVQNLSWPKVAAQTGDIYRLVLKETHRDTV